jgi:TPR repeat protein
MSKSDDASTTGQHGATHDQAISIDWKNVSQEDINRWRVAAKKGAAYAQTSLGVCYRDGLGVDKDAEKADFWFRRASENDSEPFADT